MARRLQRDPDDPPIVNLLRVLFWIIIGVCSLLWWPFRLSWSLARVLGGAEFFEEDDGSAFLHGLLWPFRVMLMVFTPVAFFGSVAWLPLVFGLLGSSVAIIVVLAVASVVAMIVGFLLWEEIYDSTFTEKLEGYGGELVSKNKRHREWYGEAWKGTLLDVGAFLAFLLSIGGIIRIIPTLLFIANPKRSKEVDTRREAFFFQAILTISDWLTLPFALILIVFPWRFVNMISEWRKEEETFAKRGVVFMNFFSAIVDLPFVVMFLFACCSFYRIPILWHGIKNANDFEERRAICAQQAFLFLADIPALIVGTAMMCSIWRTYATYRGVFCLSKDASERRSAAWTQLGLFLLDPFGLICIPLHIFGPQHIKTTLARIKEDTSWKMDSLLTEAYWQYHVTLGGVFAVLDIPFLLLGLALFPYFPRFAVLRKTFRDSDVHWILKRVEVLRQWVLVFCDLATVLPLLVVMLTYYRFKNVKEEWKTLDSEDRMHAAWIHAVVFGQFFLFVIDIPFLLLGALLMITERGPFLRQVVFSDSMIGNAWKEWTRLIVVVEFFLVLMDWIMAIPCLIVFTTRYRWHGVKDKITEMGSSKYLTPEPHAIVAIALFNLIVDLPCMLVAIPAFFSWRNGRVRLLFRDKVELLDDPNPTQNTRRVYAWVQFVLLLLDFLTVPALLVVFVSIYRWGNIKKARKATAHDDAWDSPELHFHIWSQFFNVLIDIPFVIMCIPLVMVPYRLLGVISVVFDRNVETSQKRGLVLLQFVLVPMDLLTFIPLFVLLVTWYRFRRWRVTYKELTVVERLGTLTLHGKAWIEFIQLLVDIVFGAMGLVVLCTLVRSWRLWPQWRNVSRQSDECIGHRRWLCFTHFVLLIFDIPAMLMVALLSVIGFWRAKRMWRMLFAHMRNGRTHPGEFGVMHSDVPGEFVSSPSIYQIEVFVVFMEWVQDLPFVPMYVMLFLGHWRYGILKEKIDPLKEWPERKERLLEQAKGMERRRIADQVRRIKAERQAEKDRSAFGMAGMEGVYAMDEWSKETTQEVEGRTTTGVVGVAFGGVDMSEGEEEMPGEVPEEVEEEEPEPLEQIPEPEPLEQIPEPEPLEQVPEPEPLEPMEPPPAWNMGGAPLSIPEPLEAPTVVPFMGGPPLPIAPAEPPSYGEFLSARGGENAHDVVSGPGVHGTHGLTVLSGAALRAATLEQEDGETAAEYLDRVAETREGEEARTLAVVEELHMARAAGIVDAAEEVPPYLVQEVMRWEGKDVVADEITLPSDWEAPIFYDPEEPSGWRKRFFVFQQFLWLLVDLPVALFAAVVYCTLWRAGVLHRRLKMSRIPNDPWVEEEMRHWTNPHKIVLYEFVMLVVDIPFLITSVLVMCTIWRGCVLYFLLKKNNQADDTSRKNWRKVVMGQAALLLTDLPSLAFMFITFCTWRGPGLYSDLKDQMSDEDTREHVVIYRIVLDHFSQLLLDLPFVALGIGSLWRIPNILFVRWSETRTAMDRRLLCGSQFLRMIMDIPTFFLGVLMCMTGWRFTTVLEGLRNQKKGTTREPGPSDHLMMLKLFGEWLLDLPFAILFIPLIMTYYRYPILKKEWEHCGSSMQRRFAIAIQFANWVPDMICMVLALPLIVVPWRWKGIVTDIRKVGYASGRRVLVLYHLACVIPEWLAVVFTGMHIFGPWRFVPLQTIVAESESDMEYYISVFWNMVKIPVDYVAIALGIVVAILAPWRAMSFVKALKEEAYGAILLYASFFVPDWISAIAFLSHIIVPWRIPRLWRIIRDKEMDNMEKWFALTFATLKIPVDFVCFLFTIAMIVFPWRLVYVRHRIWDMEKDVDKWALIISSFFKVPVDLLTILMAACLLTGPWRLPTTYRNYKRSEWDWQIWGVVWINFAKWIRDWIGVGMGVCLIPVLWRWMPLIKAFREARCGADRWYGVFYNFIMIPVDLVCAVLFVVNIGSVWRWPTFWYAIRHAKFSFHRTAVMGILLLFTDLFTAVFGVFPLVIFVRWKSFIGKLLKTSKLRSVGVKRRRAERYHTVTVRKACDLVLYLENRDHDIESDIFLFRNKHVPSDYAVSAPIPSARGPRPVEESGLPPAYGVQPGEQGRAEEGAFGGKLEEALDVLDKEELPTEQELQKVVVDDSSSPAVVDLEAQTPVEEPVMMVSDTGYPELNAYYHQQNDCKKRLKDAREALRIAREKQREEMAALVEHKEEEDDSEEGTKGYTHAKDMCARGLEHQEDLEGGGDFPLSISFFFPVIWEEFKMSLISSPHVILLPFKLMGWLMMPLFWYISVRFPEAFLYNPGVEPSIAQPWEAQISQVMRGVPFLHTIVANSFSFWDVHKVPLFLFLEFLCVLINDVSLILSYVNGLWIVVHTFGFALWSKCVHFNFDKKLTRLFLMLALFWQGILFPATILWQWFVLTFPLMLIRMFTEPAVYPWESAYYMLDNLGRGVWVTYVILQVIVGICYLPSVHLCWKQIHKTFIYYRPWGLFVIFGKWYYRSRKQKKSWRAYKMVLARISYFASQKRNFLLELFLLPVELLWGVWPTVLVGILAGQVKLSLGLVILFYVLAGVCSLLLLWKMIVIIRANYLPKGQGWHGDVTEVNKDYSAWDYEVVKPWMLSNLAH